MYVAQAEDLKNVALFGKMSPWVEIESAGITERTAAAKAQHTSPVWSQLIFLDLCASSSPVKVSVMTGGSKLIGGFFLPPKYFRDGSRSSYTTIGLKDSKGKFAGRIKLAWQLQYPHSVIGPSTTSSRRLFEAFSKIPPRSRLIVNVFGTRNFRVGRKPVKEVFFEVACNGSRITVVPNRMTPRGPVFNVCLALPIHLTKDIANRYRAKKYAPKEIEVSIWHKTWKGKMVDGTAIISMHELLYGRKKVMWIDLGGKGGHLKASFQLQKPDSAIYLPGTVLSSDGSPQHVPQPRVHSVEAGSVHAVACEVVVPEGDQQQRARPVSLPRRPVSPSRRQVLPSSSRRQSAPPLGDESRSFTQFFQQISDTGIDVEDARRLYRESMNNPDDNDDDHDGDAKEDDSQDLTPLPPPPRSVFEVDSDVVPSTRTTTHEPSAPPTPIPDTPASNMSITTPQGGGSLPSASVLTVPELEALAEQCSDIPIADPAFDSFLAESI